MERLLKAEGFAMKRWKGLGVIVGILTVGTFGSWSGNTTGVKYVPFTPLEEDAVVIHGDVEKEGQEFVMRIRELRGSFIPPHTHPVDEHITVLAGKVWAGGPPFRLSFLSLSTREGGVPRSFAQQRFSLEMQGIFLWRGAENLSLSCQGVQHQVGKQP